MTVKKNYSENEAFLVENEGHNRSRMKPTMPEHICEVETEQIISSSHGQKRVATERVRANLHFFLPKN